MKIISCILILRYVIFCNLHYTPLSEPIISVNVKQAQPNEFPFVVSLSDNDEGFLEEVNHFCTGTLVSKKHVLTAAHCMESKDLGGFHIKIGSNDLRGGECYLPDSIYTYNEWASQRNKILRTKFNDIAIVTLMDEIESVQPATMGFPLLISLFGASVTIAGWGVQSKDTCNPARYLHSSNLAVISHMQCESKLFAITGKKLSIRKNQFCTFAEPSVLLGCGDSGGPLLKSNNILVGVNEGTIPHPDPLAKMNVHASLYYYKEFIDDVLAHY